MHTHALLSLAHLLDLSPDSQSLSDAEATPTLPRKAWGRPNTTWQESYGGTIITHESPVRRIYTHKIV